jgi:hypothetical protein
MRGKSCGAKKFSAEQTTNFLFLNIYAIGRSELGRNEITASVRLCQPATTTLRALWRLLVSSVQLATGYYQTGHQL